MKRVMRAAYRFERAPSGRVWAALQPQFVEVLWWGVREAAGPCDRTSPVVELVDEEANLGGSQGRVHKLLVELWMGWGGIGRGNTETRRV